MLRQAFSLAEDLLKRLALRDRRGGARYRPDRQAPGYATVICGDRQWRAEICNLSCEGISLQVPEAVPVGSLVSVALSNKSGLFARTLEVRVVHVRPSADGYPVFGGSFTAERLTAADLAAILTN
jgi:hypothetical protein